MGFCIEVYNVSCYYLQTGHESVKVPESACVHEMVLLNTIRQGMNQSKFLSQHVYMRWFY